MAERRGINPNGKGVYQSYMESVTDDEPIIIVPTGEPRERDAQYEGPPYFFPFVVPGRDEDPQDRKSFFFLIENEAMYNAMVNGDDDLGVEPLPIGQEIRFSVRGRGEGAQAVWQVVEGGSSDYQTESGGYESVEEKYRACLDAAIEVAADYEVPDEDYWEFVRNVATHFSMSFSDRNLPLTTDTSASNEVPDEVEEDVEEAMGGDELPF